MNTKKADFVHRNDIQALRGFAVLLVVAYHARLGAPLQGYLGVDIFFVVSGFLITTLVCNAVDQGGFLFREFYFRRAKRLLPAAYTTFLCTTLLAPFFLGAEELRDYVLQLVGAVTFTGNVVLWQQAGYFDGAAELKPLLHVWSLSIEEQYYFLLPAFLFITPKKYRAAGVVALTVASLTLCVAGGFWKPVATFYLLPTRAWELGIGSIGACLVAGGRAQYFSGRFFWVALLSLILLPFIAIEGRHPGVAAFVVCIATLVVIIDGRLSNSNSVAIRVLGFAGDRSYSLYLVHWPIFAFMGNAWVGATPGELPLWTSLSAVLTALILAELLYRYVEDPIRRMNVGYSLERFGILVGVSGGLVLISATFLPFFGSSVNATDVRRVNFGLDRSCDTGSDAFSETEKCKVGDDPQILLWGDSYAMHLVPGIVASGDEKLGLVQATRTACGPLLGLAPVESQYRMGHNEHWAESCIAFNDSVLSYLRGNPEIRTVVLSSPFRAYVERGSYRVRVRSGGSYSTVEPVRDVALAGLSRTVDEIRAMGRAVVIVAPPPSSDFNIGACLQRRAETKLVLGADDDCQVEEVEFRRLRSEVIQLLNEIEATKGVSVVRFDQFLCNGVRCETSWKGIPLYRDSGHFSYDGSRVIGAEMDLHRMITERAM